MKPAPLVLEKHFFTKVLLESHVDGKVADANSLSCKIEMAQSEENDRLFQVTLQLKMENQPDLKSTYTGEIHAVGLFQVVKDWPAENMRQLVQANGLAILFGAIRELVLGLTARGPWPPVLLNTFSFIDLVPSAPEETTLAESAKK